MNFTVTVEAPELVGALNKLAEALGNSNPLSGVSIGTESKVFTADKKIEEPKQLDPKKETPKKEEPKVEADPVKETAPEPTPEPEPEKEENTSGITLDIITTKTREFIQANPANRKKLKAFLEEKGVPKVSELPSTEFKAALEFFEASAG